MKARISCSAVGWPFASNWSSRRRRSVLTGAIARATAARSSASFEPK